MKNDNIWAPWRLEYLKSLGESEKPTEGEGCFLCEYCRCPEKDGENRVLWRTDRCLVVLNRFPYTGGHLLIAPVEHVSNLEGLAPASLQEMMMLARDAQQALGEAIRPQGFNLGVNINRCAGAGLPEHMHMHVVPRWEGDTNFMAVTGRIRVINQALDDLYAELREVSERLGLPK